jgi:hypothetical protein
VADKGAAVELGVASGRTWATCAMGKFCHERAPAANLIGVWVVGLANSRVSDTGWSMVAVSGLDLMLTAGRR